MQRGGGSGPPRSSMFFPVALWVWHTMGAQILHRFMALVQQRVKYTEPGRGSVTAFSTMRPESCNEPKCTSLCGAETHLPEAPGVVPSCGTHALLCALQSAQGGGGAPKGLAQPRVGGPRARRRSSSPRAGLPSVPPRGLSSWKPRARVAREPRRRVEPEPRGGGQSRSGRGGAPKGEKRKCGGK